MTVKRPSGIEDAKVKVSVGLDFIELELKCLTWAGSLLQKFLSHFN